MAKRTGKDKSKKKYVKIKAVGPELRSMKIDEKNKTLVVEYGKITEIFKISDIIEEKGLPTAIQVITIARGTQGTNTALLKNLTGKSKEIIEFTMKALEKKGRIRVDKKDRAG